MNTKTQKNKILDILSCERPQWLISPSYFLTCCSGNWGPVDASDGMNHQKMVLFEKCKSFFHPLAGVCVN